MRAALIMSVVIWGCIYLAACSGSVGCFYKPINGMEEKQTYQERK